MTHRHYSPQIGSLGRVSHGSHAFQTLMADFMRHNQLTMGDHLLHGENIIIKGQRLTPLTLLIQSEEDLELADQFKGLELHPIRLERVPGRGRNQPFSLRFEFALRNATKDFQNVADTAHESANVVVHDKMYGFTESATPPEEPGLYVCLSMCNGVPNYRCLHWNGSHWAVSEGGQGISYSLVLAYKAMEFDIGADELLKAVDVAGKVRAKKEEVRKLTEQIRGHQSAISELEGKIIMAKAEIRRLS